MGVQRLDDVAEVRAVGKGARQPWFYLDSAGQSWVGKSTRRMPGDGSRAILAEAISALLGRALGVQLPDFAVVHRSGEVIWLSRFVDGLVEWNVLSPGLVAATQLQAVFVLDTIVWNEDRNAGNLLHGVFPAPQNLWAIDHEQAQLKYPGLLLARAGKAPALDNHALPFYRALLGPAPFIAATTAQQLSRQQLHDWIVDALDAAALGYDDQLEADLRAVLYQRCQSAAALVDARLRQLL